MKQNTTGYATTLTDYSSKFERSTAGGGVIYRLV